MGTAGLSFAGMGRRVQLLLISCLLNLQAIVLMGQGLRSMPVYGHPYTSAVAGISDDASSMVSYPASLHPGKKMLGIRALRLPVDGSPTAVHLFSLLPVGRGLFGLQTFYAGNSIFQEGMAHVSYGMPLTASIAMGLRLGYSRMQFSGYPSRGHSYAEWAALMSVTERLRLATRIGFTYPLYMGGAMVVWRPPLLLGFSAGYQLSEQLSLAVDMIKEEGELPILHPVVYYKPVPSFSIRTGMRMDTGGLFISLLYDRLPVSMELGARETGKLGWALELSATWQVSKNKDL